MSLIGQNQTSIGIDISDYKLRLVQLKKRSKNIKITSLSEVDVPLGIISNGIIQDKSKLIGLLKDLKKNTIGSWLQGNKIIVNLPEKQSFIKLIKIQKTNKNHILKQIDKNIPFSMDEIYFDYTILSNLFNDSYALHFGAGKKIFIDQYLNVLKQADLNPEVLELETESTARCLLPFNNKNNSHNLAYIVADLGRARTTLSIIYKNYVIFSISFTSIMQTKKAYLSEIVAAINKVLDFYYKEIGWEEKISAIITCGSGAYIKNINQKIKNSLEIPVFPGDPWENVSKPDLMKKIEYPLTFATSIGLALQPMLFKDYT